MPIYYPEIEQRSAAWHMLRCGIPTCSEAEKICTAGGKKHDKPKVSESGYALRKLAEWALTTPIIDERTVDHMEAGTQKEPDARRAFTSLTGTEVELMGFVINDAGTFGCSPDSLFHERRGVLELKCPTLPTHLGYLLDPASLIDEYWVQLHAQSWVLAPKSHIIMSYFPGFPSVVLPFEPEPTFMLAFDRIANDFLATLGAMKDKLREYGLPKAPPEHWAAAMQQRKRSDDTTVERFLAQSFWTPEDEAAFFASKGKE